MVLWSFVKHQFLFAKSNFYWIKIYDKCLSIQQSSTSESDLNFETDKISNINETIVHFLIKSFFKCIFKINKNHFNDSFERNLSANEPFWKFLLFLMHILRLVLENINIKQFMTVRCKKKQTQKPPKKRFNLRWYDVLEL